MMQRFFEGGRMLICVGEGIHPMKDPKRQEDPQLKKPEHGSRVIP